MTKFNSSYNTYSMSDIEVKIQRLGHNIFSQCRKQTPSIFNKDWWSGKMLDLSMSNKNFKLQLFRFIDVFPSLTSNEDIRHHIQEYFNRDDLHLPATLKFGLLAMTEGITSSLALLALKKNIHHMAKLFISGQNIEEALPQLKNLWDSEISFTTDLLGEKALCEKEAENHLQQYLNLIEKLSLTSSAWKQSSQLETASWGKIPRCNISVKISSLNSQLDPLNFDESLIVLKTRLLKIFKKAQDHNCTVYLDMEHYELKDFTLALFKSLLEDKALSNFQEAGIVLQAYLKDTERDLLQLIEWGSSYQRKFYVRLVKGAYWDHETTIARLQNWPCPVFQKKEHSDANYEKLTNIILDHTNVIRPAFASHNIRSLAHAITQAHQRDLSPNSFELQMLWGMAEPIKKALCQMGYRVRDYVPIGDLVPGMAFLVRRLLENTSNESFLRQSFVDNEEASGLLRAPHFDE